MMVVVYREKTAIQVRFMAYSAYIILRFQHDAIVCGPDAIPVNAMVVVDLIVVVVSPLLGFSTRTRLAHVAVSRLTTSPLPMKVSKRLVYAARLTRLQWKLITMEGMTFTRNEVKLIQ